MENIRYRWTSDDVLSDRGAYEKKTGEISAGFKLSFASSDFTSS